MEVWYAGGKEGEGENKLQIKKMLTAASPAVYTFPTKEMMKLDYFNLWCSRPPCDKQKGGSCCKVAHQMWYRGKTKTDSDGR